jgi:hypothetical protein
MDTRHIDQTFEAGSDHNVKLVVNGVPHELIVVARVSLLDLLLQRSENIRLSADPSAVSHLQENVAGAALTLSGDDLGDLCGIGS